MEILCTIFCNFSLSLKLVQSSLIFFFFFNLQSTLGLYQKPRSPSQEVLQFCLLWAGGCFCLKVGVGDPRRSVPCRAGALSRVDGTELSQASPPGSRRCSAGMLSQRPWSLAEAPCPFTHVRAKASSRNQTPHSYSTGLEDIGKTAKELDDFKKPEFLLGSGLCLEEVSSPVGLRNPKL